MENIQKILQELEQKDSDWGRYLKREVYNDAYIDDTKSLILKLIEEIRILKWQIIDAPGETSAEIASIADLEQCIGQDNVHAIDTLLESSLDIYYRTRLLRKMGEAASELLTDVFQNLSAYYDPLFFKNGTTYGIDNDQDFIEMVICLDQLISLHVSRHFAGDTASREFKKLVGVSEAICECYKTNYQKWYDRIQSNILLDRLEELEQTIKLQ